MKSFKQFVSEAPQEATFTFGRFNPPTIGHEKLLNAVSKAASGGKYFVFASQSNDPKKNPIDYQTKVKFMRKMFPRHARNVILDAKVKNVFDILNKLHNDGFTKVTMVVGSDRVAEFDKLTKRYNGVKARHGFYDFESINIISAGERDPDADGVSGMSASKMRAAAEANDFELFSKGLPSGFKEAKELFNAVRKGMGLEESHDFRKHVQLEPVSEEREAYIEGTLLNEGDVVEYGDDVGQVIFLGTNYVIVESASGIRSRKWISDVQLIERKDKETGQPKKYMSGIKAKSTKKARDSHFEKGAKMDDDNPDAYKPAPGDATAKTKPSEYTKKYKQMFGEEVSQKQIDDLEKFGDRLLQKFDIDVEFTRHFADRMNDKRNSPEIKVAELQKLFKKIAQKKGKQIKQNPDDEAVIKDLSSDLNLPVVIRYNKAKDEFEVTNKTIMRKKNFATSNKVLSYEDYESSFEGVLNEDTAEAIKNKAEKSGISYGILKKVFDRGVAAWRTGHRPGTTPTQWGLARVNSFIVGGKTRKTADADLWKKHKGE
jgi:hypothetical protein